VDSTDTNQVNNVYSGGFSPQDLVGPGADTEAIKARATCTNDSDDNNHRRQVSES
jgi:hypothetical protein